MEPLISITQFKKIMLEMLDEDTPVRSRRLSKNDKKTLSIISEKPDITNAELAAELGMTEKGSWRLLATLRKHEFIRSINERWEVVE